MKELATAAPRLAAPQNQLLTGHERFLGWWQALNASAPPGIGFQRAPATLKVLVQQLAERRIAHESVQLADTALRDQAVRTLNDHLIVTVPAILAAVDDGKLPTDRLAAAVVAGHNRFAIASPDRIDPRQPRTHLLQRVPRQRPRS